jgi:penicillin-binding protein 2
LSLRGLPGGFVAMNVNNGEVLGLGSYPTYDPSVFARPLIPPSVANQIFGLNVDDPFAPAAPIFNRATQGLYPTGSTYKPITALAALDSGELTLTETINDPGQIQIGDQIFTNAGEQPHGTVDLRAALQVSSDVFFYALGRDMNVDEGAGGALQEWSRSLGIGEPTGIDIGQEGAGNLPTPEVRNEHYQENTDPDSPCGEEVCLEEGEVTDRPWSVGDNVNLAVGQGDLQADPLQMAVAYAAIANGGDIVRPHTGLEINDPQGRAIQEIEPAPRGHVEIDPQWRQTILEGLHDAAMTPGGTSFGVFGGYPKEIAGKTGTAERPPHEDQSWYVALAPYPDPKYVVAVTIEEGGFGADAAAPATLEILNELLDVKPSNIETVGEGANVE